jgi:hypothetical protein
MQAYRAATLLLCSAISRKQSAGFSRSIKGKAGMSTLQRDKDTPLNFETVHQPAAIAVHLRACASTWQHAMAVPKAAETCLQQSRPHNQQAAVREVAAVCSQNNTNPGCCHH